MARYNRLTFLVEPSAGDISVYIRNMSGEIVFEIFIKSIMAMWQEGNLVKIKTDSSDKAIILDFSSSQEALVALKYLGDVIDIIRNNIAIGPVDDNTSNYIDLKISETFFTYHQVTATTSWFVTHNMGVKPSVTLTDNSFFEIEGLVRYLDDNNIIILFNQSVSGWLLAS